MGAKSPSVKKSPRATLPPDTNSLSCPINKLLELESKQPHYKPGLLVKSAE